jgi:hypothetical protein
MRLARLFVGALCVGALCFSCSGGKSGAGAGLRLIEFLESEQDNIPRNRVLTFRFSEPVAPLQDFFERLKIRNVDTTPGSSNFARAAGTYTVTGDKVVFTPQLPNRRDRGDAGFRANGNYTVFLKSGPDSLRSVSGAVIATQQEFIFDTNEFFEDPQPADPPRAISLTAVDSSSGQTTDLSRLDPRPNELAMLDSNALIQAGKVIDPGGGGLPDFQAAWHLELLMSEPLDPSTVTTENIEMFEVYGNATTSADTDPGVSAPVGHFGDPVDFKVPIVVEMDQGLNAQGVVEVRIRVIPQIVLVDDTRYVLRFSGKILGLDFRQTFIGENGLTGDGQTPVDGGVQPFPEPGGLGYVTEFIVRDRPAISATRVLTYDPLVDGIQPETGDTSLDPAVFNSALYNPPTAPGTAVGFLGAFGSGVDGDLAVSGGQTTTLDTGDTPNEPVGRPFQVWDLDPGDTYKNSQGLPPPGFRTYDSYKPTIFDFASITVSSSSTLKVVGVNPCRILSAGLVQVDGVIDAGGEDGGPGSVAWNQNSTTSPGEAGAGGPGGFAGGEASSPISTKSGSSSGSCTTAGFDRYLNDTGVNKSGWPWSKKGEGPGRGNQGGEVYQLTQQLTHTLGGSYSSTGTGGGGASHATTGTRGEDQHNVGGQVGTYGKCTSWGFPASSLIGLRGMAGPTYPDREAFEVLMGGSGGGAGGGAHGWYNSGGGVASGGGGGGGGGFLEILSAGDINVVGVVDVSGGDGGKGAFAINANNWSRVAGSGGGGAGGTLSLISGNGIRLADGMAVNALGGVGGERPNSPPQVQTCSGCNAGGDGGKGYIFLMSATGAIGGNFNPGTPNPGEPGNYDSFEMGVLTIRSFDVNRFGGVAAVTELYSTGVADPAFLNMTSGDILAIASGGQRIRIWASSSKADPEEPTIPDITTEIGAIEMAVVTASGGSTNVDIIGDLRNLNPSGGPDRDAFVRMRADFLYDDPIEAALGPFMVMDQVTVSFTFNG